MKIKPKIDRIGKTLFLVVHKKLSVTIHTNKKLKRPQNMSKAFATTSHLHAMNETQLDGAGDLLNAVSQVVRVVNQHGWRAGWTACARFDAPVRVGKDNLDE